MTLFEKKMLLAGVLCVSVAGQSHASIVMQGHEKDELIGCSSYTLYHEVRTNHWEGANMDFVCNNNFSCKDDAF